jgi:hypothetical protein
MMTSSSSGTADASERISELISSLGDWRGDMLVQLREVVREADPEAAEQWKWNTPVWSHGGLLCAVAAFNDHVKMNFFEGAALADPDGLFNAGLDAKSTRSIDLREGDVIDAAALKRMVGRAVAHNAGTAE